MIPLDAMDLPAEPTRGLWPRFRSLLLSQRRNLQNLSALVVFNFLAAGLFFVTQVKIANVIGREQFGLLAYGMVLGVYGQTIVRYGMDRTLVRDLIHYPDRFSELVVASLLLRGVLLALVAAALLAWKLIWQPADLSWPVIAVVIAYSLKSLDLQPVYDAWHCMARHAVYNAVQRGLYFLLIWVLVLASPKHLSLAWIAFGLLATEMFYLALQQRWAFRRIAFTGIRGHVACAVRELSKTNLWIWLATIGALSFTGLNQIILKHYWGPSELGVYAASWQIAAAATLLLNQMGRIGNPATAHATRQGMGRTVRSRFLLRYCAVMALAVAPISIPLCVFPELIVKSLFTAEYASSAAILRVLGAYLIILSLGLVASQYVISARMERTYLISVVLGGLLSIVLCLILIPVCGARGAAISLLVSHGSAMVLYWCAAISSVRENRPCR